MDSANYLYNGMSFIVIPHTVGEVPRRGGGAIRPSGGAVAVPSSCGVLVALPSLARGEEFRGTGRFLIGATPCKTGL